MAQPSDRIAPAFLPLHEFLPLHRHKQHCNQAIETMRTLKSTSRIGLGILGAAAMLFGSAYLVTTSAAATINIAVHAPFATDPNYSFTGVGMAPDSGTHWNEVPLNGDGLDPAAMSNLKDSLGNTTSVGFSLSPVYADYGYYYNRNESGNGNLLNSMALTPRGLAPSTITLSNLAAGGVYDLYIYSSKGDYDTKPPTSFTINGVTQTAGSENSNTAFILNQNYLVFSGVTVGNEGLISISFQAQDYASENGIFNGLQLYAVPEPSTVVSIMLGLALVLLLHLRRSAERKRVS